MQTQVQLMSQAISRNFPEDTKVTKASGRIRVMAGVATPGRLASTAPPSSRKKLSASPQGRSSLRIKITGNFMRLNCGGLWSDRIEQAVATLGQLVTRLAKTS